MSENAKKIGFLLADFFPILNFRGKSQISKHCLTWVVYSYQKFSTLPLSM